MQIKSWQIVLAGVIMQGIVSFLIINKILENAEENFFKDAVALYFAVILVIGLIISLLLYLVKTRKIGAIISIILSILAIIFIGAESFNLYMIDNDKLMLAFTIGTWSIFGIFLLFASIHYFWKKV